MNKETPFDKEIEEIKRHINTYKSKLQELEQSKAEYLCPSYKVGDVMIGSNGKVAKLVGIKSAPSFSGGYDMFGSFQRKDGSFGRKGELYKHYDWKLKDENRL